MDRFHPDVAVVLVGAWEVLDHVVDGATLRVGTPEYEQYLLGELGRGLDLLESNGQPVVVLTSPCFDEHDPQLGASSSDRNDPDRLAWVNARIRTAVAAHPGVALLDLESVACPGGGYHEKVAGVTMREDGVHFSRDGAAIVWRWLGPQLRALTSPSAA
jgi:hypothetical protein